MRDRSSIQARYAESPEVSVLIVGGGINGAGLFRELALQGVDVLLVERSDFCAGASCASSRMIHGGLRYLEFGEFRLVQESLRERNRLLQNAPHYVRPLRTTIPVFSWTSGVFYSAARFLGFGGNRPANRGAAMVKVGLSFYDLFTRKNRLMPRHAFSSKKQALRKRPGLNPALRCTGTFYDAWISYPERLCLELLLDGEALCPEAHALNYVAMEEGDGGTVTLRDGVSGGTFCVRPKVVVNATGAWIDFTNSRLAHKTEMIGGTKGAHLVLDNQELFDALDGDMIYYETPDGRVSVALPWLGRALIGSTDIRIDDPDKARCTDEEIDYIISAMSEAFPKMRIDRSQIVSYFSGVRPLPRSKGSTVEVSRDHSCPALEPEGGAGFSVHSMVGGKWTTFRGFSEHVADTLLEQLGLKRKTGSQEMPIGGGRDYPRDDEGRQQWIAKLERKTGLPDARLAALLERYGTRAADVAWYIADGEDEPLNEAPDYSRREIEFMALHEQVVHLDDLVLRRTALALLGHLTPALLDELAGILGEVLDWPKDVRAEEYGRAVEILKERHGIDLERESGSAA